MADSANAAANGAATGAAFGPWGALIGAGVGLMKNEMFDRPQEARDRRQAAETARWSPWTGMQPGPIKRADPFGSVAQGALTGMAMGQRVADSKSATEQGLDEAASDGAPETGSATGDRLREHNLGAPLGYHPPALAAAGQHPALGQVGGGDPRMWGVPQGAPGSGWLYMGGEAPMPGNGFGRR